MIGFSRPFTLILFGVLLVSHAHAELRSMDNTVLKKAAHLSVIPLWPSGTPDIDADIPEKVKPQGKRFYDIHNPNITVYKAKQPNGIAVVLCAGGGYSYIATGVEGVPTAEKLNKFGITVFVLKYRLPPTFKHPVPLSDAMRAIQLVRHHATDFDIDPDKVGIMGFSAGGHLASSAGTLFSNYSFASDRISKERSRPDFMALVYPVISTRKDIGNKSAFSLVEGNPNAESLALLSNELNVMAATPPAFLVHAKDDLTVSYQNSVLMHQALKNHGVPSSLYLYEKGGHGFGVGREGTDSAQWTDDFIAWLQQMYKPG